MGAAMGLGRRIGLRRRSEQPTRCFVMGLGRKIGPGALFKQPTSCATRLQRPTLTRLGRQIGPGALFDMVLFPQIHHYA